MIDSILDFIFPNRELVRLLEDRVYELTVQSEKYRRERNSLEEENLELRGRCEQAFNEGVATGFFKAREGYDE